MKKMPIGVDNFETICARNYIYADKTKLIYALFSVDNLYFLSRPRRFGKTLLLSTLEAILANRRELFEGLWIGSSDYDWTYYPTISISLADISVKCPESVESGLIVRLESIARREKLKIKASAPSDYFYSLIDQLNDKHKQKVAILIDEYDAPILKQILNSKLANEIRLVLRDFYGVLKTTGKWRGFTFITGVTKFTKTSLFSEVNNLTDLTLDPKYANICGFTIEEFDSLFQEHMEASLEAFISKGFLPQGSSVSDLRQSVLEWYDGYSWDKKMRVLNPWSVLNCFDHEEFNEFWWESGTPTFLVDLIKERKMAFDFLGDENVVNKNFNVIDVGQYEPLPLMFQTGYLTIKTDCAPSGNKLSLIFPNLEVKAALIPLLLTLDTSLENPLLLKKQAEATLAALTGIDASGFEAAFSSFMASIPFSLHLKYEAYYHTIFILAMALAGQPISPQGESGEGKFDVHLKAAMGDDFVVEIKYLRNSDLGKLPENDEAREMAIIEKGMKELAERAMAQIEEKKYDLNFKGAGNLIYKVALVVSERTNVKIVFNKAENWVLVKDGQIYKVQKT